MATQEEYGLMGSATWSTSAVTPSKARVRIGLCPRSQPFDESMDSLSNAISYARTVGIDVVMEKTRRGVPGFQNWGPALHALLEDNDATHIFAAADDMLYPHDILERLVSANKDVICGIYRKSIIDNITPANWVADSQTFISRLSEGGIYETQFASGHTMLIKRSVIQKMVANYPELAYDNTPDGKIHYGLHLPIIMGGKCYQDDWAFSIRARASGFTIWDHYGCKCYHWGGAFLGFPEAETMHV
jgi:hypothetical protein